MLDNSDSPNEITIKPQQGSDNSTMIVPTSDGKAKKLCCMYCHKRYQALARHLFTVHRNEAEVKTFKSLPPGKILLRKTFCLK